MTFDDFCAFCAAFRDPREEEMQQIIFQILKLSPNYGRTVQPSMRDGSLIVGQRGKTYNDTDDYIMIDDFKWLCSNLIIDEQAI